MSSRRCRLIAGLEIDCRAVRSTTRIGRGRNGGEQLPAYGIGERSEDIHVQKVTVSVTNRARARLKSCARPRGAGCHLEHTTDAEVVRDTGRVEQPATDPASAGALPKVVAIVAGVAVALVLVLSFIVLIGGYRWVPGVVDCTVGAGERTVELTSDDAEQAASVSARSCGEDCRRRRARHAVAEALDLSDEDARVVAAALTGRQGARPDLPARRRGRRGAGPARPRRPDRPSRGRTPGPRQGLRAAASGWFRARGRAERAHARVGALRGPRRRRVLPAGDQAQPRQGMGDRAVPRGPCRPVDAEHGDLRRLDLDAPAVDPGLAGVRRDTSGRSAQVAAILEHRDHVHVDVAD